MVNKTIAKNGIIIYRNEKGQLHREDGPAIERSDGSKNWYINGLSHRIDGPAFYDPSRKEEEWRHLNLRHRVKGPAVDFPNLKAWWKNGQRHRLNAPAVLCYNSKEFWEFGTMKLNVIKDCYLL